MSQSAISTGLVAKNTVRSFIGQAIPLVFALVFIPRTVHTLGVERFGALSLAWVLLGHFTLFDFGLARATSKHVAEALGRKDLARIPSIVWTSLALQMVLGVAGGALLVGLTPLLVGHFLKLSPALVHEVKFAFYLLGFALPLSITAFCLRAVLEAAQRFDLSNWVRIPFTSIGFVLPVVGAKLGLQLPGIIVLLIASTAAAGVAYMALCFSVLPTLRRPVLPKRDTVVLLLAFGGWVTLCNLLIPPLVYLDRWLIGAMVSVEALGFYTAGSEVALRLQVFPQSLGAVIFPAFSTIATTGKREVVRLYARSLTYLLLLMGPAVLVLVFFAREILTLWIGEEVAKNSVVVFQILAPGVLLNALSQVPANLLDGMGRPDLRAKLFAGYLLPYAVLAAYLIHAHGIVGAALAWSIRGLSELCLFLLISGRLLGISPRMLFLGGWGRGALALGGFAAVVLAGRALAGSAIWPPLVLTACCLVCFVVVAWRYVIDGDDRTQIRAMFPLVFR